MQHRTRHYFNNILFTPWPFGISVISFNIVFMSLLISNKYYLCLNINNDIISLYCLLLFSCFIDAILCRCKEITQESISGKYTKKLRSALLYGFLLFLLSEAVLFGSIFWAYFDRLFNLSYTTGFLSVPSTTEIIRWYREPLFATIILVTSGWTCNLSHYYFFKNKISSNNILSIVSENRKYAYLYSFITIFLGILFSFIQYSEYSHLRFNISDNIYTSVFYTLTGFHGLHVLVGTLFLFTQYYIKFWYLNNRTSSLTMAVLYWHFVDIIWLFLWFFVYYFNNLDIFSNI